MQRGLANVERVTIERRPAMVPCTYATDHRDQWDRKFVSCGSIIPFRPLQPCPECGVLQARPNAAHPGEGDRVAEGDIAVIDAATGEVAVVYVECAQQIASELAANLRNVEFDRDIFSNPSTTTRLSGIAITHRTFGYQPPAPLRRRYGCSRSQFNAEHPKAMDTLARFCSLAEYVFRTLAEDVYERTAKSVLDLIAPAWRIAGTPWTSGIINQTAALPYHRDQANVVGSWSAMIGARSGVDGGLLHLLDYDLYLPIRHGSVTIFDGQSVAHGVTPMRLVTHNAWRYTSVVYSKRLMSHCCSDPAGELRRAQVAATVAEEKRAKSPTAAQRKSRLRQPRGG